MSCPFSSGKIKTASGGGGVCPVTGKSASPLQSKEECADEDESFQGGCYISRSGGLDFDVHNQLDNGERIPLKNIPQFFTLSNLKNLLHASSTVTLPPSKNWDDIFFCMYDNLAPLREDRSLESLDIQSGDVLYIADKSNMKPIFIKVITPEGKTVGLNYVPPWATLPQLKKMLAKNSTSPLPLDIHQCVVESSDFFNTEMVGKCTSRSKFLLKDEIQLGSLGNLLEITFKEEL